MKLPQLKPYQLAVLAFVLGCLVTAGALGAPGYFKLTELSKDNQHLKKVVKTQKKRLYKYQKTQTNLNEEFKGFKEQSAREHKQTLGALFDAQKSGGQEALFKMGVKAYTEKDYPRAYFALSELEKANAQYEGLAPELAKAKQAYQKYKQDQYKQELQATYLKAFDYQGHKQLAQAKAEYQKVVSKNPKYKDAQKRLNIVSKQLALRTKKTDFEQEQFWLKEQYALALKYQSQGSYLEAKKAYEEIIKFAPKYKDTDKRLVQVISLLPAAPKVNATKTSNDTSDCYKKGEEYGRCYALLNKGQRCTHINVSEPPAACKNNPDFKKGFQTTAPTGAVVLLRGLSNFLKSM